MIIGFVNPDKKAEIRLTLLGANDETLEIPIFVDTGFNGFLALPYSILAQISSTPSEEALVYLADGSTVVLPAFAVQVSLDNKWCLIEAFATNGDAVLGMRLLENHSLKIEVRQGGAVTIESLNHAF